jgi:hypothetical protein
MSRNTLRKVLRSAVTAFSYGREVRPRRKPGRWMEDSRSAAGEERGRASRLTLIRIFEELRALGFEGGYDVMRRYAGRGSKAHLSATASAFVPLTLAPGGAYQFYGAIRSSCRTA